MGPETEKRAPSARISNKNKLWRPVAAVVVTVLSAVYTDADASRNLDNTDLSQQLASGLRGSFTLDQLNSQPLQKIEVTVANHLGGIDQIQSESSDVRQPEIIQPLPQTSSDIQPAVDYEDDTKSSSVEDWLKAAGWPEELLQQAVKVTSCESKNQPEAINPNGLYFGLFQLEKNWFDYFDEDFSQWSNPVINARVAYKVYLYDIQRGNPLWKQWDCKP